MTDYDVTDLGGGNYSVSERAPSSDSTPSISIKQDETDLMISGICMMLYGLFGFLSMVTVITQSDDVVSIVYKAVILILALISVPYYLKARYSYVYPKYHVMNRSSLLTTYEFIGSVIMLIDTIVVYAVYGNSVLILFALISIAGSAIMYYMLKNAPADQECVDKLESERESLSESYMVTRSASLVYDIETGNFY